MFGRHKRSDDGAAAGPEPVYDGLRAQALGAVESGLAAPSPDHPGVSGVVIDVPGGGGGFATFVALTDDTTSMYTSTGGGTIGAGAHAPVAAAAHRVLREVQAILEQFPAATGLALPSPGLVQVTVLTPDGSRQAHLPEAAFWGREPSTVGALIGAIQQLITAISEADPPA